MARKEALRGASLLVLIAVLIAGFAIGYLISDYNADKDSKLKSEQAYFSDAWNLLRSRNYDAAITEFDRYLAHNGDNVNAHIGLGWSYYWKGDYESAIQHFSKAESINPNEVYASNGLAWTYIQMSRYEDAKNLFLKQLESDRALYEAHYGLGISYYWTEDYDKAVSSFNDFLAYYPSYAPAYSYLGWSYLNGGKTEEAKKSFESAAAGKGWQLTKLYSTVGLVFTNYKLENFDKAEIFAREVEPLIKVSAKTQIVSKFLSCMDGKEYSAKEIAVCVGPRLNSLNP